MKAGKSPPFAHVACGLGLRWPLDWACQRDGIATPTRPTLRTVHALHCLSQRPRNPCRGKMLPLEGPGVPR